jgi:phosphoribosyl-ATP pyrophosphohydrolase/phosphoribosyl-AMP cyclohydrolase
MKLKLNQQGLIPAIAQDGETGKVLMLAYMSPDSVSRTVESGEAWFYSRSRKALWHKGEISGNVIKVDQVQVDCDNDTLLLRSEPTGPACHTGNLTCFFEDLDSSDLEYEQPEGQVIDELFEVIESRKGDSPEGSYVARLLQEGVDRIGKKVIEEAGETVIAAKNGVPEELVHEVADLWFHSLVLLSSAGLKPEDIWAELRSRRE